MNLGDASIYTDFQGLTELKAQAGRDADGTLDKVARQFESLFIQQMLKSMRQASLGDDLMESDQSLFYRDMYDQQLAIHMSESGGIGIAEAIKRQLGGSDGDGAVGTVKNIEDYRRQAIAMRETRLERVQSEAEASASADATDPKEWKPEDFVEQLWPWAREAASLLGLKPQALLAQAALETGWGRHMIHASDGKPANNLFGIKADQRWSGERASVDTLEYEGGVPVKKRAFFRAYDSLRGSFMDYVDFVKGNPRYREALESTADSDAYFTALQQAGYATDPKYAKKINAVLNGEEMRRATGRLKGMESRSL
jgi:flagellar protein FlgJ